MMETTADRKPVILVVDDNRMYREAVRRHLEFLDYDVVEANDKADAIYRIRESIPDLIITDLDMKTPTEGLDLIREVKTEYPLMPIILISAVGTFDEGALAREYGATYVISKSRIEGEIDKLFGRIEKIFQVLDRIRQLQERYQRVMGAREDSADSLIADLQRCIADPEVDTVLKGEIYDMVLRLSEREAVRHLKQEAAAVQGASAANIRHRLEEEIHQFSELDSETRNTFISADQTKLQYESDPSLPADRMASFAYCFAVENEVKQRIGKKVVKLLTTKKTLKILEKLYDRRLRNLDLFFNRELLLTLQKNASELNVDLVRQVLGRIMQHGEKYKPDGLKALGVIVFCFGRDYECQVSSGKLHIGNPLGVRGLDEKEVNRLASQLVNLQHLRNPYIHPEFSEREQIDRVRGVAIECINLIAKSV
jgi:CheY-like chemotaxis protein